MGKNIIITAFKIIIKQNCTIREYEKLPRVKYFLKRTGNPGNQSVGRTSDDVAHLNYLSSGYNVEFFIIQVK